MQHETSRGSIVYRLISDNGKMLLDIQWHSAAPVIGKLKQCANGAVAQEKVAVGTAGAEWLAYEDL
jgi:hypothetical protein